MKDNYYVGITPDNNPNVIFNSNATPTKERYGHLFSFVEGPHNLFTANKWANSMYKRVVFIENIFK